LAKLMRTPRRACAVASDRDSRRRARQALLEHSRNTDRNAALHLARIEDLGHGDLVKVDCAACSHLALLTREFLIRLGLSLQAKVRELPFRCRGCGAKGRAVVSIKWRRPIA
jgi:hypothetical protein